MGCKYESSLGKGDADHIVRSKYIGGEATKSNLDRWAKYAKDASFDPSASRRQSKRDLDAKSGREDSYPERFVADQTDQGDDWKHYSDLSRTNSYTGKGGSKRD